MTKNQRLFCLALLVCTGCATYKKVENTYIITAEKSSLIREGDQQISGSDAKDSLNGNTPTANLKLSPLP